MERLPLAAIHTILWCHPHPRQEQRKQELRFFIKMVGEHPRNSDSVRDNSHDNTRGGISCRWQSVNELIKAAEITVGGRQLLHQRTPSVHSMLGCVKALNTIRKRCFSHTLEPQECRGLQEALRKDFEPVLAHTTTGEHGGSQDLCAQTQHMENGLKPKGSEKVIFELSTTRQKLTRIVFLLLTFFLYLLHSLTRHTTVWLLSVTCSVRL